MRSIAIASIVLGCTFGAALAGIWCRSRLPEHHLDSESKDVVRIGMALIATMAALILSLVIASAKSAYDDQASAVRNLAAYILTLDRTLAQYGPETKPIRELLRQTVAFRLEATWPSEGAPVAPAGNTVLAQNLEERILEMTPKNDAQRWLQSQALGLASDALKTRWTAFAGAGNVVPAPFLVIVVFWLTALFWSFGLFAPRNATVLSVLLLCALSVAAAVFLILEMESPFTGIMSISSAPLRYALALLGQ